MSSPAGLVNPNACHTHHVVGQKFQSAGYSDWTMTHAFFADMGGFVLRSPDFPPFPLDAEQLYYLISEDFLAYPEIDRALIDDKNKADGLARYARDPRINWLHLSNPLARLITVWQVLWFSVTCIGRLVQHIGLTTLELTTLGFILLMLATSFCWRHKPSGVTQPFFLETSTNVFDIRSKVSLEYPLQSDR